MADILPSLKSKPVSGSAFTQSRYKIKPEFFKSLCDLTRQTYEESYRNEWKGHRLLAGDGSSLSLPPSPEIKKDFGIYAQTDMGVKRCLARIFFLYDPLNDFVVESAMGTMEIGEKPQLYSCLEKIDKSGNDIIVLDRGFGDYCTLNELIGQGRKFCIRLPAKNSSFAKRCMISEETDFLTWWSPSRKEGENSKERGRELASQQVRITKIELSSGEVELLVSNLFDMDLISQQDLKELYGLRWGVEEGFKNLKPKMKIEQFGCRKTNGLYQEFYAHVFFLNIVALTAAVAMPKIKKKTEGRRHKYKYNWKNAYRFTREIIVRMLNLKNIRGLLDDLISNIASSITAIKPNRLFARDTRALGKRGRISPYNK